MGTLARQYGEPASERGRQARDRRQEQPALWRRSPPRWLRLFPIVFFLTYLTTTVLLFAFGPWPYPVENGTKLYAFITAAHLALLLGYLSAIKSTGKGYSGQWRVKTLVFVSVAVGLPILYATTVFRVDVSPWDLIGGVVTLGDAYKLGGLARSEQTPVIEYVRFFVGPVLALLFPLVVFYWKSLSTLIRVLAVACIVGNLGMFVLMGTNKLIADTVILFPWLILASHFAGYTRIRWTKGIALSVTTAALFIGFLLFFTETQNTRAGASTSVDAAYFAGANVWADNDNFMVRNLNPGSKRLVLSGVSYLAQGYYALYLSLDKPFVPTFGVGNSFFLVRQAARVPGLEDIDQAPYPMRIEEQGWDAYGQWSSIYPWIASDVSFPGTLIVVFLIGRLFALCWLDTLQGANPFAIAMFAQLLIMLYYFNANNQCLQSGEDFSAFTVLLILWLTTRRRQGNGSRRRAAWN